MEYPCRYGRPAVVPVLALGALSTGVIDQALDLVRDFRTARLLGAPAKALLAAQLVGAVVSVVTSAVLYHAYVSGVKLPSAALPCVIAKSYRGLAFAFAGGASALPDHCLELSAICGFLALGCDVLRDVLPPRYGARCPSGIAVGAPPARYQNRDRV